jgi:RNA polymerase sigma-32 factor
MNKKTENKPKTAKTRATKAPKSTKATRVPKAQKAAKTKTPKSISKGPKAKTARAKATGAAKSAKKRKQTPVSQKADKALVKFDPLQRYLTEISNYSLLTREEEREYGTGISKGLDAESVRSYPGRQYRADAGG